MFLIAARQNREIVRFSSKQNKYIIQLDPQVITEGLLVSPNGGHPHPEIAEKWFVCVPLEREQYVSKLFVHQK